MLQIPDVVPSDVFPLRKQRMRDFRSGSPISGAEVTDAYKDSLWENTKWMRLPQSLRLWMLWSCMDDAVLQYYIRNSSSGLGGWGAGPAIQKGGPQSVLQLQEDYTAKPPW